MLGDSDALVLALVHSYITNATDDSCAWIPEHSRIVWSEGRSVSCVIRGHYRRKSKHKKSLTALRCTTKFVPLANNRTSVYEPPVKAVRHRKDEDGQLIPRCYRVLAWL